MTTFKKLLDLLTPKERRRGILLLGMVLVMAILDVVGVASIIPFMSVLAKPDVVKTNRYLAPVYNYFGDTNIQHFLFLLGVAVFVTLVVSIAFKAITNYALLRFSHMRNYTVGKRLVSGYLRQPYEWYLNRHSADLGKAVLSEAQVVIHGALLPLMQMIAHSTVALALLVLLIAVDPVIALVVAAVFGGAYAGIYLLLRRYLDRIGKDRVQANGERFQSVQEAFGGIKDVKVAGLEKAMLRRFGKPAMRFAHCQATAEVVSLLPRFALEIVAFGGMLVAVLFMMTGFEGFKNALPKLTVYVFAGYRLMPALQQVYTQLSKIRFAGPAIDILHRDLKKLNTDDDLILGPIPDTPLSVHKGLRLDNVSYTYPEAASPTLNSLSFEIPAFTKVGLVGTTGSGKTTTVDIILGLLRPRRGQLLVDDQPITKDNLRAWQRNIGYVSQHIFISDDTVASNIAFGLPKDQIDQVAVESAARIANLHAFIVDELPSGYATTVGERGVRLSGGQRQRIGIARALYHDPQVLIMDEATSALDNLTEQAVMEAVRNIGNRKTIILIAHRLTTVRDCDQILVLEKGRLVGQGRYDELVEKNIRFRAMAEGGN